MMRRCEIDVIKVIANRLKLLHGPVKYWAEDNFSEYGIILGNVECPCCACSMSV